jgi:CubicO group peptidase (beta-lactamase class C family)
MTDHAARIAYDPAVMIPLRSSASPAPIRALAAALVLAAAPLSAQQGAPPKGWGAFTRLFDTTAARDSIVGASVVVVRDGRIVARHAYGFADRARQQRVDDATLFHYGSITKTLTAIAIMQLRDRGKLTLDDRVVDRVPELRLVHDPYGSIDSVTIRMLLSHSAGFQNPTWPYTHGKSWEPFEPTTWNQLVAMMPYQEVHFKPGSRYSYSNPGFIYLARIIEQLSGDPWETYVQKNILSPLGLTRSYFGITPYYLARDRSHNYTLVRDSSGREMVRDNGAEFDPGITIPNGGWNAPLDDLATYLAFLTDATRGDSAMRARYDVVLPHADFAEMWRPRYATDSSAAPDSMGLSFFVAHRGGATLVGHTGSQAGFLSFMYLNPVTRDAIIASFNTDSDVPRGNRPSAFNVIREAALSLIQ